MHYRGSRPFIDAVAGMRCVITVEVANRSGHPVQLTDANARSVGPGSQFVVRAANADGGFGLAGHPEDAQYSLDRALLAGHAYRFHIVIGFRPSGCTDGARVWAVGWPTVGVSVWGRTFQRPADHTFAFYRAGPTPGCGH